MVPTLPPSAPSPPPLAKSLPRVPSKTHEPLSRLCGYFSTIFISSKFHTEPSLSLPISPYLSLSAPLSGIFSIPVPLNCPPNLLPMTSHISVRSSHTGPSLSLQFAVTFAFGHTRHPRQGFCPSPPPSLAPKPLHQSTPPPVAVRRCSPCAPMRPSVRPTCRSVAKSCP